MNHLRTRKILFMKKIRVIHILHSFGTGGMEKGVATIISHASNSFEHIVLCLTTTGETERLLPAGTKIIELHKKPGNSPGFYFEMAKKFESSSLPSSTPETGAARTASLHPAWQAAKG